VPSRGCAFKVGIEDIFSIPFILGDVLFVMIADRLVARLDALFTKTKFLMGRRVNTKVRASGRILR